MTEHRDLLVNIPASYSEVRGSNLSPETGYPEFFVVFISPSRWMLGYCLKIRLLLLPSKSFPIDLSLITLSFEAI
jgi:hypothetical protein